MAPKQHSSVGIISVAKGIRWVPESASGVFMGLCACPHIGEVVKN